MKKLLIVSALSILVACNNKEKTQEEVARARQATLDSVNTANNHQRMLDSMTAVSSSNQDAMVIESPTFQPAAPEPRRGTTPKKQKTDPVTKGEGSPTKAPEPSGGTSTVASQPSGGAAGAGTGTVAAEEKKKKGLNNAAKGAIIGLGTGAAAGAVINKENRGKGAVIGGVVGAIGGAVGGAVLDKRKAKKEAAAKDTTDKK